MSSNLSYKLSFREELANSITHGVGALIMLILLPISAIYAYRNYNAITVVGICIFVCSLFFMFLSSCIYHAMGYNTTHKYVLRIIDHSMIFIAIAGSYTPVALSVIGGILGVFIMIFQWGLTIFGIVYKSLKLKGKDKLGLILYISMGWVVVFMLPKLIKSTNITFATLMFIGGLFYTIGVIFYLRKKPYSHTIWHIFILCASICQYIGIVFFMIN